MKSMVMRSRSEGQHRVNPRSIDLLWGAGSTGQAPYIGGLTLDPVDPLRTPSITLNFTNLRVAGARARATQQKVETMKIKRNGKVRTCPNCGHTAKGRITQYFWSHPARCAGCGATLLYITRPHGGAHACPPEWFPAFLWTRWHGWLDMDVLMASGSFEQARLCIKPLCIKL